MKNLFRLSKTLLSTSYIEYRTLVRSTGSTYLIPVCRRPRRAAWDYRTYVPVCTRPLVPCLLLYSVVISNRYVKFTLVCEFDLSNLRFRQIDRCTARTVQYRYRTCVVARTKAMRSRQRQKQRTIGVANFPFFFTYAPFVGVFYALA